MNQDFDFYNQYEKPDMVLCNPNKTELYSLNMARDVTVTMRYNALSEISFTLDYQTDNGQINPAYDFLKSKRLIKVDGYGYFIISKEQEDTSTPTPFKKITAFSLEAELINKKVIALGGTFKFFGAVTAEQIEDGIENLSLINYILALIPSWSVGTIDAELWNIYRTFEISDTNVYNFLMTDVETAFGCIFVFDTDAKTISALKVENATTTTDIFISKENLIESVELEEISSEIVTAMSVFGGNDLNIRAVNPLGGNYIYNFDYYKNIDWMSQDLIDALNAWDSLIATNQPIYAGILTDLFVANGNLLVLQGQLADLQSEYLALEGVQKSLIELGESDTPEYQTVIANMTTKQGQIDSKETEITNQEVQITSLQSSASAIVSLLSFENNFTPTELLELQSFIIENTYQNKNIIQTDIMTQAEIQVQAQQLYDDGMDVLEKASMPRYEFSMNSVNFVFLKEFQSFTEQLNLGAVVTINAKHDVMIESVLLEIEISFDNPDSFSLTFSNRLRLDNGSFIFSDLFGTQNRAASAVDFNGGQWSNWTSEYKDSVSTFITSSLDASKNAVINATNQEITIGLNGLRGRKALPAGGYDDKQVWLTSNTIAFTDDNWDSAKLAIGEVQLSGGGTAYGVVGEVIVGRLIAGNELRIENTSGTFVVDAAGATLTNSKLTVQDSGNKTRINISPTGSTFSGITIDPGITVLGNSGGGWSKKFWVDSAGNVNFAGNLTGATGTFSGTLSASVGNIGTLVIDSQGLKTADGVNYMRGNGDFKWGGLTISGGTATFNGNIYANNIKDNANNSVFNASGNMVASRLLSGTTNKVSGLFVVDSFLSYGQIVGAFAVFSGNVETTAGGHFYDNGSTLASQAWVNSQNFVQPFDNVTFNDLRVDSNLIVQGWNGYTTAGLFAVSTPSGTRYLRFVEGVLVQITS